MDNVEGEFSRCDAWSLTRTFRSAWFMHSGWWGRVLSTTHTGNLMIYETTRLNEYVWNECSDMWLETSPQHLLVKSNIGTADTATVYTRATRRSDRNIFRRGFPQRTEIKNLTVPANSNFNIYLRYQETCMPYQFVYWFFKNVFFFCCTEPWNASGQVICGQWTEIDVEGNGKLFH